MSKLKGLPIGFVGTCLGLATLSNVYNLLGYAWVRHLCMWLAGLAAILGVLKVILFFPKVKEEYKSGVLAAMYTTITMCAMLFGSYIAGYNLAVGKAIFWAGMLIHMCMILCYTIYHIFMNFKYDFLLPAYFVTYNGLLVSTVAGINMLPPALAIVITYYGIGIYILILIFLIPRIMRKPIPDNFVQTKTVLLAPCSLCFVSYLNFNNVAALKGLFNPIVALLLYVCVLLSLLYILCNTFKFFESGFTPLFGALTFPMAIGTLAGFRAGAFFSNIEAYKTLGAIAVNITGFQILISSTFMCLVFFNFVKMYLNSKKE